jgi:hypothetical protein
MVWYLVKHRKSLPLYTKFLGAFIVAFDTPQTQAHFDLSILTYSLTHSMVLDILWKDDSHLACQRACLLYGNRSFITVLTKARNWTLTSASRIQFTPSIPVSLRSILSLPPTYALVFPVVSYLRASQPEHSKHLSPPPRALHVPPTSSSLI